MTRMTEMNPLNTALLQVNSLKIVVSFGSFRMP